MPLRLHLRLLILLDPQVPRRNRHSPNLRCRLLKPVRIQPERTPRQRRPERRFDREHDPAHHRPAKHVENLEAHEKDHEEQGNGRDIGLCLDALQHGKEG